jgi:DNA-binding CsgD family transcriptional regulator
MCSKMLNPIESPKSYDDALMDLHRAMDHRALWHAFQELVDSAVAVDRMTLFLGHIGMGDARMVYTEPRMDLPESWFEERGKLNPFSPWIAANIDATHYRFSEIVGPPELFRKTEFYERFAKLEGWDKGFSCLYWDRGQVRGMFSLYRSEAASDFSEEEEQKILHLRGHVEIALHRVQHLHRERNFKLALEDFNRKMPVPLALVDWNLNLVFANIAAYEQCAIWNFGSQKARAFNAKEKFRIPSEIVEKVQVMKSEIEHIAPQKLDRMMPAARTVISNRDIRWTARLSASNHGQTSMARPGFFILFYVPNELDESEDPSAQKNRKLRDLQKLTHAEREIVKQVCLGKTNKEIADALSKSILTVKTQLNAVFQKLEVRNRATLVNRYR